MSQKKKLSQFQSNIKTFYKRHGRTLPWRDVSDPYKIVVSEIMLQQTQVDRVIPKFRAFIKTFPNFSTLARASKRDVLKHWQGLGYNRRALALHEIAKRVAHKTFKVKDFSDPERSVVLPGIGPATAGSIAAFAFNIPAVFIETNIRRVYINYFFPSEKHVHDEELFPLIEETLDHKNPREWYAALMDYGSTLPKATTNPNRRSAHYAKQSAFKGSDRQIRGSIVKMLTTSSRLSKRSLLQKFGNEAQRVERILTDLEREGFVTKKRGMLAIQ